MPGAQGDIEMTTGTQGMFDLQSPSTKLKGNHVVCLWMDGWMCQVTSPEKTGLGDVKTEKTKKRQKLQKKTKN